MSDRERAGGFSSDGASPNSGVKAMRLDGIRPMDEANGDF